MERIYKNDLKDRSDDDLLSLLRNPKNLEKSRLSEMVNELKNRGLSEQVDEIEANMIKVHPIYSKFWSRIGAYIVDVVILGAIGFILSLFFKDFFVQLGNQGVLVGFFISLLYFGIGNSKISNGQTFGKAALKLRVVGNNLENISISKAFIRALIYTIPYFFLNYSFAGWSEFSIFFIAKGIVFLTFLILLPIHLIINTPTRQALHDLILSTYVINIEAYPRQELNKSRIFPLYIISGVAVLILGLTVLFNVRSNDTTSIYHKLKPLKEQIDKIEEVGTSVLSRNTSSMKKLGSDEYINKTEYFTLNIVLKENIISNLRPDNIEDLKFVQDAVRIILKNYSEVNQLDYIVINLTFGYSIGIYKSSNSIGYSNTIENWRKKVK